MVEVYVGTSGWSFPNWVGPFYPEKLARPEWLAHYAGTFAAVELNASFYRLPQVNMLKAWDRRTPDEFRFSVKVWQLITHKKRLRDCEDQLQLLFDRMAPLESKIGAWLFQLPPRFPADLERLDAFLELLPGDIRAAFEFRDPSWHCEEVYALLRRRQVAFVPFELADLTAPRVATTGFVYVRLHGHEEKYRGRYPDEVMEDWAAWIRSQMLDGQDAFVFFDNTDSADDAVRDALRMRERLAVR